MFTDFDMKTKIKDSEPVVLDLELCLVWSVVSAVVDVFHWEEPIGADSCVAASSAAWHFS